jgi:hypothetical protein
MTATPIWISTPAEPGAQAISLAAVGPGALGSTPWDPSMLPGLVAWYDAQDDATITQAGGTVSQWNDKSGHGYNVVQGTAANQPAYNATGLNGFPALTFNGTSNYIVYTSVTGLFSTGVTEYFVGNPTTTIKFAGITQDKNGVADPYLNYGGAIYFGNGVTHGSLALPRPYGLQLAHFWAA